MILIKEGDFRNLNLGDPKIPVEECKKVAWGYVPDRERDTILVAERYKESDPKRQCQLVIPGGSVEESENYREAAMREVKEETGIDEESLEHVEKVAAEISVEKEEIVGLTDAFGNFRLKYTDTGKKYIGQLHRLKVVGNKTLGEPVGEDTKRPQWMPRDDVYESMDRFTPACQVLLDAIRKWED